MNGNFLKFSTVFVTILAISQTSKADLVFILLSNNYYYELHINSDSCQPLLSFYPSGILYALEHNESLPLTNINMNYQSNFITAESYPNQVSMTLSLLGLLIQVTHEYNSQVPAWLHLTSGSR